MGINDYAAVADLYDIYVPATFDIDFFITETKKISGDVLELMSGTGRVSIPLIEAGVNLTCVDKSAELNAVFAKKLEDLGLKAEIHQMDVRELELGRQFAMAIIPFNSFSHITSPVDQRKTLERIRQHLRPGGIFICTLTNPKVRQKTVDGQLRLLRIYPLPETGGELLLWIVENRVPEDARIVEALQFYEEYDSRGVLFSKRYIELYYRFTQRDEFEALARAAGFRVNALYGDYSRISFNEDSPFMIWVLEKAD
ncbi:methylase [Longilinea arvoryzae]|uniref:Methylase n=1 Tax=Longilinea arvoryzae TaxID=360412 RepID=A0A0S7BG52_9CHLR|nr:class I SAM-dependent methyltransferase [Longilinea arvoryzae]GAP12753.1 methylase [Longilinea arvoryzae]